MENECLLLWSRQIRFGSAVIGRFAMRFATDCGIFAICSPWRLCYKIFCAIVHFCYLRFSICYAVPSPPGSCVSPLCRGAGSDGG